MARTSEATREDVKMLWAELNVDGDKVTGVELHKKLKAKYSGRNVRSVRAVQEDVRAFKNESLGSFAPKVWNTWRDGVVHPDSAPIVLLVNTVSMELAGRPLWQHEAKWAERVSRALEELDPVAAWFLVWSYALREVVQKILQDESPFTKHLDLLTANQPWKQENRSNWNLLAQSQSPSLVSGFLWLEDLGNLNLPIGVDRELARWATRQLIGPWDNENGIEWDWHSLLERQYGQQSRSRED